MTYLLLFLVYYILITVIYHNLLRRSLHRSKCIYAYKLALVVEPVVEVTVL